MSDERRELLVEIVKMLDNQTLFDEVDLRDVLDLLKLHRRENVELEPQTGQKCTMRIGHYLMTETIGAEISAGQVEFDQGDPADFGKEVPNE